MLVPTIPTIIRCLYLQIELTWLKMAATSIQPIKHGMGRKRQTLYPLQRKLKQSRELRITFHPIKAMIPFRKNKFSIRQGDIVLLLVPSQSQMGINLFYLVIIRIQMRMQIQIILTMSTSLPKIKTVVENSEAGSQKNLKFKKLKLSTDGSAAEIRERFKSMKTQRLSSLERYSSAQEQREYKNQKIHMNLLERKLLSGTYDEKEHIGNDLKDLKQKTDFYKIQSLNLKKAIEKIKTQTEDTKKDMTLYVDEKNQKENVISKINQKLEKQKHKTETMLLERAQFEHMIIERKKINIFHANQVNEDKAYLTKLKGLNKHIETEWRESIEKVKNLERQIEQASQKIAFDERKREEAMNQKQTVIEKRKDEDQLRDMKSKEYRKSLEDAEIESELKGIKNAYHAVLAQKFASAYSESTMNSLKERYQKMDAYYNRVASYQKFDKENPMNMVERFTNLKPEEEQYQKNITVFEKDFINLEIKYNRLQEQFAEGLITSSKNRSNQPSKKQGERKIIDNYDLEQSERLNHEERIRHEIDQRIKIEKVIQDLSIWSQKYGKSMNVEMKKSTAAESISENILKIMKSVVQERHFYEKSVKEEEERKIREERERKEEENQLEKETENQNTHKNTEQI